MLSGLMKTFEGVFRQSITQWRGIFNMNLLLDGFNYFLEVSKNAGSWGRVRGVLGKYGGNSWNASPALRMLGAGGISFRPLSFAQPIFLLCWLVSYWSLWVLYIFYIWIAYIFWSVTCLFTLFMVSFDIENFSFLSPLWYAVLVLLRNRSLSCYKKILLHFFL